MRVSDERIEMEASGTASYIPGIERHLARDLRDARALLKDVVDTIEVSRGCEEPCECGFLYAMCNGCAESVWEHLPERIRQYLEGSDA